MSLIALPGARARLTAWQKLFVPPVISCNLPLCDQDCVDRDRKGLVCPRAASTIIALRGHMPGKDACMKIEDGWKAERRPTAGDADGCG